MVLDGLRSYVQLASGLTDVTRERARAAARALVAHGEAGVGVVLPGTVKAQVSSLTDDLIAASRANRTLLLNLVRLEVERSVARLGLVSAAELDSATRRAARLEARVADLEQELRLTRPRSAAKKTATRKTTARKTTAKRSTAKKTAAKKATAEESPAKQSPAQESPAKQSTVGNDIGSETGAQAGADQATETT